MPLLRIPPTIFPLRWAFHSPRPKHSFPNQADNGAVFTSKPQFYLLVATASSTDGSLWPCALYLCSHRQHRHRHHRCELNMRRRASRRSFASSISPKQEASEGASSHAHASPHDFRSRFQQHLLLFGFSTFADLIASRCVFYHVSGFDSRSSWASSLLVTDAPKTHSILH